MKQFERIYVFINPDKRYVKRECVIDDFPYIRRIDIGSKHQIGNDKSYVADAHS